MLALYADAMLRVWDLDRHTVLAAASLPQLPQLAGMHPVALRVAADATGACLLCVQHRRGDDVARASSVFSVHAVEEDGSGAYRLSARCVIAQALTGVVSSCLLEGGALWALCAAEDGPQVQPQHCGVVALLLGACCVHIVGCVSLLVCWCCGIALMEL